MKLEKLAQVAEIVSGAAVVVSLVFLILGIRENTAMTRVSVYSDLMDSVVRLESLRVEDENLERVLGTFYNETTDTLNDSERGTVTAYVATLFRNYERAYFSREYDVIGDVEWGRFERLICANSRRAKLIGLDLSQQGEFLTSAFREYIGASCGEARE